jgi:hypothetical protein
MITDHERDLAVAKSESGGLLNLTELALVLCVGRDFVRAMVAAGFQTFGGKTTVSDALSWLRANPDFKTRQDRSLPKFRRKLAIQRRNGAIGKKRSNSRRKFQSNAMAALR